MEIPRISEELRDTFVGCADEFDNLEEVAESLIKATESPVEVSLLQYRNLTGAAQLMARGHLLRSVDLVAGCVDSLNREAGLAAIVLVRALVETFMAVNYSRLKTVDALDRDDTVELYDDLLPRLAFGNRYLEEYDDKDHPKSFNIMTMIDFLDRYYKREFPDKLPDGPEFRKDYEFLSEFAHPGQGSVQFYLRPKGAQFTFDSSITPEDIGLVCSKAHAFGHMILIECEELAALRHERFTGGAR